MNTSQQLINLLNDTNESFSIIEYQSKRELTQLLNYFSTHIHKLHTTIDLSKRVSKVTPNSTIRNMLKLVDNDFIEAIFIINITGMESCKDITDIKLAQYFNARKNDIIIPNKSIVFCFPSTFVNTLLYHAKDFYEMVQVHIDITSLMDITNVKI